MQFYELEACLAIADSLNFARACEKVNLSPSALSRLVSRIEDELNVKIFIRDTRSVVLTEEGKSFIQFARTTLSKQEELINSFNFKDDKLHGELKIFASVTACYSILPPLVELLSEQQPDLKLVIETGDPADASIAIKEGKADLAVDAIKDENSQNEFFTVHRSPLVFAASNTGKYGQLFNKEIIEKKLTNNEISDKELASLLDGLPLILAKIGLSRNRFDKWCKKNSFHPNITAESGGHEGVLALARLGIGVGLVPRIVLENSPFARGLVSIPVTNSIGFYDIGFILAKQERMNKHLHDKLIELIKSLR